MPQIKSRNPQRWPKQPPPLSAEQERAREGFMALWHQQLPTRYGIIEQFNHGSVSGLPVRPGSRTLEVGAGLGAHSKFEDLSRQDYHFLEYREEFCQTLREQFSPDRVVCGSIEDRQPWPSCYFERIVVIHVLEHLRNLPAALEEMHRLLDPQGYLDVVMPCEGSLAYALARKISAERLFRKHFRMDYTPIIRNEHVSTLSELLEEIEPWFDIEWRRFFPLPIPIVSVNLCMAIRAKPRAAGR